MRSRFRSLDLVQHGIDGVSGVREFHFHRHNRKRLKRRQKAPQIHRILLSRYESTGVAAPLQFE